MRRTLLKFRGWVVRKLFGLGYIDEDLALLNKRVTQLDQDRCIIERDVRNNADTKLAQMLSLLDARYAEMYNHNIRRKARKS